MDNESKIMESWGGPDCPIDTTLELISRKWVIAIIRDMFAGKKHFSEFKKNKPKLNNSVLSDTLKFMIEQGLIEKVVIEGDTRSNTEYHLTDKSRQLNNIIYGMVLYGLDVLSCCEDKPEIKKQMKKEYKNVLKIND